MSDPYSAMKRIKKEYQEDMTRVSLVERANAEQQTRAELRDRFAIEIVGSLILRMPAENHITPAMCKTVWDIADSMVNTRDGSAT